MNYSKVIQDGYTIYTFDKIYPIEKVVFDKSLDNLEWSINDIRFYNKKIKIEDNEVTFTNVHLRYLKILGDVELKDILQGEGYIITEAPEVTNVFRRNSGWTGADGVYQHNIDDKINWYFSDTFVGEVDEKTRIRKNGFSLVNNTLGISDINNVFDIDFMVNKKDNKYQAFFKPPNEGYYWLQDGIYLEDKFYLTVIKVVNSKDPNIWFSVVGAETLEIPCNNGILLYDRYKNVPTNYYIKTDKDTYTFGASILDDRERSGFIYVFGYNETNGRNCVVSRVKNHLLNNEYEYLTNNGWKKEAVGLKELAASVACEFKVIYDCSNYLITYTKNGIGTDIVIGKTKCIEDGFHDFTCVYDCIETDKKDSLVAYNAKIQCFPGVEEQYITYHVNTLNDDEHVDAEIYYPRWIKLRKSGGNL